MSTLVGVISDTHGLLRPEAAAALQGVDRILHGGDVDRPEILDALRTIAPVTVVRGNCDYGPFGRSLPLTEMVAIEDAWIYMIHILDDIDIRPAPDVCQAVVFGHTHKPVQYERNGVLYLNPGSAGPRRFSLPASLARLTVDGARIAAEHITLDV